MQIPQIVSEIPAFAALARAAFRQAWASKISSLIQSTFQFFLVIAFPGQNWTHLMHEPLKLRFLGSGSPPDCHRISQAWVE